MKNDLETIKISEIFNDFQYLIPIYQRNFAWTEIEIEQLIEDIESAEGNYYLGNLIVNYRVDDRVYEVIDGQQRLTTLYLLRKYLGQSIQRAALQFEAREKSNRTLNYIPFQDIEQINQEGLTSGIIKGYEIIKSYFEGKEINPNQFSKKLESVSIVQVKLPEDIDLNHYFEIMNTRGEQLELHEIAKAKLLEALETDSEREVAALIWENCSDMDSYVQMNFEHSVRSNLFTKDWASLDTSIRDFGKIEKELSIDKGFIEKRRLIDILNKNETLDDSRSKKKDKDSRFESTISFPNFLLQVNAVLRESAEDEASLDDKNFLDNLSWAWSTTDNAKKFLFSLLKYRALFDRFIVKREYIEESKKEASWSLQRMHKEKDGTPGHRNSLADNNKMLEVLQASLRITYTSPKTMHWITLVLKSLLKDEEADLVSILEGYSMQKVTESNYEAYEKSEGFAFERIVFTYLDYLLYRDGYSYRGKEIISARDKDYKVQFRSSIEHLYPQNPISKAKWEGEYLHSFGNLVLITVSDNAGFSNLPPESKIHKDDAINRISLKLKIMEELIKMDDDGWTETKSKKHKDEMFRILRNNGGK